MNNKNNESTAITKLDKPVIFKTMSGEIELSINEIKLFVAKGSVAITVAEAIQFIQLCKFNALNPWIGDAFLIKYGNDPATMVTSKYAYMKRAERAGDRYLGFKAGVVLMPKNWEEKLNESGEMPKPILMEGSITFGLDLVGGWSEILIKDKESVRTRVSFDEYVGTKKSGEVNRQWKKSPGTMIRKTALVGGLREAFPDVFGGLYSEEEFPTAPDAGPILERPENVNEDGEVVDAEFEETPGEDISEEEAAERKKKIEDSWDPKKTGVSDPPPIQRRSPRNEIKDGEDTIKTCGIGEIHFATIKNAYLRDKDLMKAIDKYLRDNGIKNITHLRKEEGAALVEILMAMESAAGAHESDEDRPEGEVDRSPSAEEKSQGDAKEEPETSKKATGSTPERNEMIPCPDRGEMDIEFSFCQDNCPKYDQKTCIHFADSPEEATL